MKYEVTTATGKVIGTFDNFKQAVDYIGNINEITKVEARSYGYKVTTIQRLFGGNTFNWDYFVREEVA